MLAPSPTLTLADYSLDVIVPVPDKVARKRAKDREYQRGRRMARRAKRTARCASCDRELPDPNMVQLHPDSAQGKVVSEPCCPYCQNMVWRTRLWWMVKTQRFRLEIPAEGI